MRKQPKYNESVVEALLKQDRTPDNIDKLLRYNYGLMVTQLKRFYLYDDPEALSIAYNALYQAILKYDISSDTRFSTYTTVSIYNHLGSYVRRLHNVKTLDVISYHNTNDDGIEYAEMLESSLTADGEYERSSRYSILEQALHYAYSQLNNPKHKAIIKDWVASEFKETQVNLAAKHNCSQVYVVQIVKKFRVLIKQKMEELQ